jgi:Zn-dependent M32 family carboxypeptidase
MTDKSNLKALPEPAEGYNDLKYYFANLNTLFSIRSTLAVDMMTAMPAGGLPKRMHDISAITKRIYAGNDNARRHQTSGNRSKARQTRTPVRGAHGI